MTILLLRYERIPKKDDIPFFSTLIIVRTLSCKGEKLKKKARNSRGSLLDFKCECDVI
jgi:hypothetical protein